MGIQIKESELIDTVRKMALGGKRNLQTPTTITLPTKLKKELQKADISQDEFLAMLVYAKHLPRGKRELKLNYNELRKQLISQVQDNKAYLTDVAGLRLGGKVSMGGSTKALSQTGHILNIKNNNRNETKPIPNVNYPYFKNSFKL
jgi:hypothetical protein